MTAYGKNFFQTGAIDNTRRREAQLSALRMVPKAQNPGASVPGGLAVNSPIFRDHGRSWITRPEDRALLGSNPSAGPGDRAERTGLLR
jgi:hypothetical protein